MSQTRFICLIRPDESVSEKRNVCADHKWKLPSVSMDKDTGNTPNGETGATEPKVLPIPERYALLWEHCLNVGIRGSDDLRKELGLDEVNFRHIASSAHAEPRRCYIYRVLDEVQKAAICIMQW